MHYVLSHEVIEVSFKRSALWDYECKDNNLFGITNAPADISEDEIKFHEVLKHSRHVFIPRGFHCPLESSSGKNNRHMSHVKLFLEDGIAVEGVVQ